MKLKSKIDNSINFIKKHGTGYFESRYVRRSDEYFITYLSSQNGCLQACRFCHLTATGQTMDIDATIPELLEQTIQVLNYHDIQEIKPKLVHYNFMARGEPLVNRHILENFNLLYDGLKKESEKRGLDFKIKISTIMPKGLTDINIFNKPNVEIYYSLYSLNETFRKRWIPKSLHPDDAGKLLKTHPNICLHHTYIEGENDDIKNIEDILNWLERHDLDVKINIVRYNPFDEKRGCETSETKIHELNNELLKSPRVKNLKIVSRVGEDVYASCGMFLKS